METLTIRVSRSTHALLQKLAAASNITMAQVIDDAVRELEEKRFWAEYQAAYSALRADATAWAELQDEITAWDSTLADGLEDRLDGPQKKRGKPRAR